MRNFIKLLGIISLALVIGFSMAACKNGDDDDDNSSSSGNSSGGSTLPEGAVTGLTVDSALVGTWKGDTENGTLVFSATGVGSPDKITNGTGTNAAGFVLVLGFIKTMYTGATFAITGGKATVTVAGTTEDLFTYTVAGSTLTIKDPEEEEGDDIIYIGTKK